LLANTVLRRQGSNFPIEEDYEDDDDEDDEDGRDDVADDEQAAEWDVDEVR